MSGHPSCASSKEPACQCRRQIDTGWIPGSGRYCGAGHGNPLQYFGLDNPMGRGARWTTVYRFTKNQTQLKLLSTHVFSTYCYSGHCIKCFTHGFV